MLRFPGVQKCESRRVTRLRESIPHVAESLRDSAEVSVNVFCINTFIAVLQPASRIEKILKRWLRGLLVLGILLGGRISWLVGFILL